MNKNYRSFFGLEKEPFGADVALKDILQTDQLVDTKTRLDYVIRLGAVGLVTGDVGSGKSTAIRYAEPLKIITTGLSKNWAGPSILLPSGVVPSGRI